MRAIITIILMCLAFASLSQQIDFNGSSEEPIFKSKQDSISYAGVLAELGKSYANAPDPKKLDSLFRYRSQLMTNGITGFRRVYRPNPTFISYENLDMNTNYGTIKELSISSGKFKRLPTKVLKCKNLETLQLVNLSISKIQWKANSLVNLKTITILNNQSDRKLKLKNNRHVERLVIRGEQPKYLPASFKKFKALVKLDLSSNILAEFPNGTNRNKNLKELFLINNAITLK
ncbi:MAG: leucine-rich repeat domain-containing protein, partial [Bacteroidia bacterium]|nr:leucine-rich repeat domain-containing protein [Bacteroidia bacterium]